MNLEEFYNLLDEIGQRPALYLGETSLTVFRGYFYGYLEGSKLLEDEEIAVELRSFHNWVAMRLGFFEGTSGWKNMLLHSENGNEEKAFEKFFVLLDEFKNRKERIIYEAQINSDKTSVVLAQIIKYTNDKGCFIRWIDDNGVSRKDEFYCFDLENAFFFAEHFGVSIKKSDWKKR